MTLDNEAFNTIMHLKAKVEDRILPTVCLSVPGLYVLHLQVPEVLLRNIALDQLAGGTRSHHFRYNFLEIIEVRVGDSDLVLPINGYNCFMFSRSLLIPPTFETRKKLPRTEWMGTDHLKVDFYDSQYFKQKSNLGCLQLGLLGK